MNRELAVTHQVLRVSDVSEMTMMSSNEMKSPKSNLNCDPAKFAYNSIRTYLFFFSARI